MSDTDQRRITLLSSRDIAALNRAREVLKRLEETAWNRSLSQFDPFAPVSAWDLGRLSDAASVADDAIFHVLSTARTNCHVKLTDAQLFRTEQVEADASPALEAAPPNGVPSPATDEPRSRDGRVVSPTDMRGRARAR
jgi:hypothetical protein